MTKKISKVSNAVLLPVLLPGESMSTFVIQQLLKGLQIQVTIGKQKLIGHANRIDLAGTDHLFADVFIEMPENQPDIDLRVAIDRVGGVTIIPQNTP